MNNTTECMYCGSINRIPSYREDPLAFNCWNCIENCWIDANCLEQYKTLYGLTYVQAAIDLDDSKVPMVDGEFNG